MAKRIVYVEPGDMIEVRICNPAFDLGANAAAWKESTDPARIMISVHGINSLEVPFDANVFIFEGSTKRQIR